MTLMLFCISRPGLADERNSTAAARSDQLTSVIQNLSDFKSFRLKIPDLENLVRNACKKTVEHASEFGIVNKYTCGSTSAIEQIRIDWRNGDGSGYVMALSIDYKYDQYENVRKIMERKLGRPTKKSKDVVLWRYISDKKLNELGNPVIYSSVDTDEHTARFEIALEQGP